MPNDVPPLFVCYVPGLDLRRITAENAPHIRTLLDSRPWVRTTGLPDVDLTPSLFTGTPPHVHGMWQVKIRPDSRGLNTGILDRLVDWMPDMLTTTVQGVVHAATNRVDLATIPPRRRRKFELHRFKYERRMEGWLEPSDRYPSIFGVLESEPTRYHLAHRFSHMDRFLPELPTEDTRLEWLELYAFDLTQHWNLDRPEVMAGALRKLDGYVADLHAACENAGVRFLLLSDHGQEPVREPLDLLARLDRAGVDPKADGVDYFLEPSYARFWFSSPRGREAVEEVLGALPNVTVLGFRGLAPYGIEFENGAFGELYAYPDPGTAFFPHDFHQPVANLFMGMTHREQRPRIHDPVHRGTHGHLPDHPCEDGFLLCADEGVEGQRDRMEITDVAPTLLQLLEREAPDYMRGRPALRRRE